MNKRLEQAATAGTYSGSISFVLGFLAGAFIMWPLIHFKAEASLPYGLLIGSSLFVVVGGMNFLLWFFSPIKYF